MASMSKARVETVVDIRILNYSRRYPTNDGHLSKTRHRHHPAVRRVRIAQRRSRQRQPVRGSARGDREGHRAREDLPGWREPRETPALRVSAARFEEDRADSGAGPFRY